MSAGHVGPILGALFLAALLVAGWRCARWTAPGQGALERLVVAVALCRIALAVLALVASSLGRLDALPMLVGLAGGLALWRSRRELRRVPQVAPWRLAAPALLVVTSAWLVQGVVGRSGVEVAGGDVLFYGHHATNDSLVYLAMARRIAAVGWPVDNPFVAGLPNLGHALWFGWWVGLESVSGADWLDVAFRLRPHVDLASLVLTAFALARALGAGPRGAFLAALLLLLGGGLSQPLFWGLRTAGVPVHLLELWAADSGFLLAFNPITPALQTGFVALLLLARARPGDRRAAVAAGVLVAAVFEFKLFLWPSLLGGLLWAAAWRSPRALAPTVRRAALAASLLSLPLVLHAAALARGLAGIAEVGFAPCPGCLPRFALESTLGNPFVMRQTFESFQAADLASPSWWAGATVATCVWVTVALGVRLAALPALWRGGRADVPGSAGPGATAVHRIVAGAALLGTGAACLLATRPHYPNVVQFAWSGLFGLWVVLAVALDAWIERGRRGPLLAVFLLALPSGLFWPFYLGWVAPVQDRTSFAERMLMARLSELSSPTARILEPSLLVHPGRPSPVAWLGGRSVYLSKSGMAAYLPAAERDARIARLQLAFGSDDRDAALAAIREAEVEWVYAPVARPLGFDPRGALLLESANAAGRLWRVPRPPR